MPWAICMFFATFFFLGYMWGNWGVFQLLSIGNINTKKVFIPRETSIGVGFDDIGGDEEAKSELQQIVEFLKEPEQFQQMGARIPRGALLTGPSGTGKTLIAKAVAKEAGVPFGAISASEFVEIYPGIGASRMRQLFNYAKKKSPSIIFIDEIESIGRRRNK